MRKELYTTPEMEIIAFATVDVIEVSGSGSGSDSSVPESSEESEQPVLPGD